MALFFSRALLVLEGVVIWLLAHCVFFFFFWVVGKREFRQDKQVSISWVSCLEFKVFSSIEFCENNVFYILKTETPPVPLQPVIYSICTCVVCNCNTDYPERPMST